MAKKKLSESQKHKLREGLFDNIWKMISKGLGKKVLNKFKDNPDLTKAIKSVDQKQLELDAAKEVLKHYSDEYARVLAKWD